MTVLSDSYGGIVIDYAFGQTSIAHIDSSGMAIVSPRFRDSHLAFMLALNAMLRHHSVDGYRACLEALRAAQNRQQIEDYRMATQGTPFYSAEHSEGAFHLALHERRGEIQ